MSPALRTSTRVVLVLAVLFGLLTLIGSVYYAVGMDSDSETLFRVAEAACFTVEGAESVERCAPLTRATVDGETLTFFSAIGFVSWVVVMAVAAVSLWLLLRRSGDRSSTRFVPRWASWLFVVGAGWLLLSPLDKVWDEEYGEGLSTPATGLLSQYLPAFVGQSSARVWLGSSDAMYAAVGRLVGQLFIIWAVALLVIGLLTLRTGSQEPHSSP